MPLKKALMLAEKLENYQIKKGESPNRTNQKKVLEITAT